MGLSPLAGKPAPPSILANIPRLVSAYYTNHPDPSDKQFLVEFGTSGHRGSSIKNTFNEDHILAIAQAICDFRKAGGILGPLFLGKDTHALSEPSFATTIEVLAANGVEMLVQSDWGYTPTPVISHAILVHNSASDPPADGIVITPSHNPPEDGGIKYNPPDGGPAQSEVTAIIEKRANELLRGKNRDVKRIPYERALKSGRITLRDFVTSFAADLGNVIDMDAVRSARIRIGVDPMGGASLPYWDPIAEMYGISVEIVNRSLDPTFGFMRVDKDGKVRMDCSSPYAMAGLIDIRDKFDVAFGNDPDCDRHGIVTRSSGLMNPNHYLSAAVWYLFQNRPGWKDSVGVAKTLVSSAMIDRVSSYLGRKVFEVPVGFKWFVSGLLSGSYAIACEESAGASFLRRNSTVWSTDKDGFIMDLLAAEIMAKSGKDPGEIYSSLTARFGNPFYERIDEPANAQQKSILSRLAPEMISCSTLAGEKIEAKLSHAPANGAPIGGIKVITKNGWFAARPSGTEDIYKIYTESFKSREHLARIQQEAKEIVGNSFKNN
ncbi:MAG TPA: phosphoglucomutase (alpha-D-glucose-1,6-bisphosphate-dependent) [Syntrophobacteraceae bacterium]|nr:phosphoglucomutase (alpha-D-glucose-1,6-bisphosphate-dependent) [Syntrophobacteraceae bacterium]